MHRAGALNSYRKRFAFCKNLQFSRRQWRGSFSSKERNDMEEDEPESIKVGCGPFVFVFFLSSLFLFALSSTRLAVGSLLFRSSSVPRATSLSCKQSPRVPAVSSEKKGRRNASCLFRAVDTDLTVAGVVCTLGCRRLKPCQSLLLDSFCFSHIPPLLQVQGCGHVVGNHQINVEHARRICRAGQQ